MKQIYINRNYVNINLSFNLLINMCKVKSFYFNFNLEEVKKKFFNTKIGIKITI